MATDDTKPAEHPVPWRWDSNDDHDPAMLFLVLEDARGESVVDVIAQEHKGRTRLAVESPYVRELLRAAPELADLVRGLEWSAEYHAQPGCPSCEMLMADGHYKDCRLAAILAALDAAREGTT